MYVAHQEPTGSQVLNHPPEFGRALTVRARRRQAVEHAVAVRVGLQAPNTPEPRVAQGTIIEVHWVLRSHDDPNPKSSGLLHQRHDWALGGRIRWMRRQKPVDLV